MTEHVLQEGGKSRIFHALGDMCVCVCVIGNDSGLCWLSEARIVTRNVRLLRW